MTTARYDVETAIQVLAPVTERTKPSADLPAVREVIQTMTSVLQGAGWTVSESNTPSAFSYLIMGPISVLTFRLWVTLEAGRAGFAIEHLNRTGVVTDSYELPLRFNRIAKVFEASSPDDDGSRADACVLLSRWLAKKGSELLDAK